MNVDKYLILIKKEDKTADIIKYEYNLYIYLKILQI